MYYKQSDFFSQLYVNNLESEFEIQNEKRILYDHKFKFYFPSYNKN